MEVSYNSSKSTQKVNSSEGKLDIILQKVNSSGIEVYYFCFEGLSLHDRIIFHR